MKILLVPAWYPDDAHSLAGIFFKEHAEELIRQGQEVAVAHMEIQFRNMQKTKTEYKMEKGVQVFRCKKRNSTPFWERGVSFQKTHMLKQMYQMILLNFGKPDVIHLMVATNQEAVFALSKREKIPVVYAEHYSAVMHAVEGSWLAKCKERAANQANIIIAISSAMKRAIGQQEKETVIIPNGIDEKGLKVREGVSFGFTIKSLGTLRKIKGYDLLIRAVGRLLPIYPKLRLIIGGDGPEKKQLEELIKELKIEANIELVGKIEKESVSKFYEDCDIFVCSSLTETFSVVVVEAMMSGIPVLATKCGGPEDLVDVHSGMLVEKNSCEALEQGMREMIEHYNMYNRVEIRENAIQKYSLEKVIEKQIAIYNRVVT